MLANMACSLIEHKRITTTLAKAKALQKFVEPIVTKSKSDSTHSRRTAFRYLRSKEAVSELFREVAPKVNDRNGGYTRIIKLAPRLGDGAEMAFIELVDFNELMLAEAKPKKSKSRRSRRGGAKKTEAAVDTAKETVEEAKAEEVVEDAKEAVEEVKAEASASAEADGDTQTEEVSEAAEEVAEAKEETKEEETKEESKKDDSSDEEEKA